MCLPATGKRVDTISRWRVHSPVVYSTYFSSRAILIPSSSFTKLENEASCVTTCGRGVCVIRIYDFTTYGDFWVFLRLKIYDILGRISRIFVNVIFDHHLTSSIIHFEYTFTLFLTINTARRCPQSLCEVFDGLASINFLEITRVELQICARTR